MNSKAAYVEHLENTIKDLQNQVNNLTEMVLLLRKEKFGPSSEKTPKQVDGQLSLFNEVELEADASVPEPIKKEVKGYTRNNPKTKREELLKDLPVREILCETAPEELYCEQCNTQLKPLGKEVVREELEYIPAKLQIVRYVRMYYECPKCKHTDHPYIQKALTPTSLMNHSLALPSSVAHVMYEKYVNSVPLYRQEKDWEQLGISLSRATMANWVIRCSQDYLIPVVEHSKRSIKECLLNFYRHSFIERLRLSVRIHGLGYFLWSQYPHLPQVNDKLYRASWSEVSIPAPVSTLSGHRKPQIRF